MSFDELFQKEIENRILANQGFTEELQQKINELHLWMEFLVSLIVAQQKDACDAAGITPETLRRKILQGHLAPLSKDGSRLNFVSIKQMTDLKPRIRYKRRGLPKEKRLNTNCVQFPVSSDLRKRKAG